ncbi:small ribosomal subunit protein uS10m-like [Amphiura filiformis]|uniref:small ribosomal subunit protein uS10m-like n=1 Tax=Amphiura filiformis TaxID=82378 RepID=UPI003B21E567
MMRKLVECSFSSMSRLWSKPVTVPCRWSILTHRPVLQQLTKNYSCSWVLCSRLHAINNDPVQNNRFFNHIRPASSSISTSTLRYYSSLHEQVKNPDEDTLYKWIELRCKGHDDAVLESYQMFVSMAAQELGIQIDNILKPKRKIHRLTLLKSRFIYKKHRVQYEMRTHFRVIMLKHLTGSTADVFLEYIERNLPEGVAMQVKKCHLESIPDHLTAPTDENNDDMTASSSTGDVGDQTSVKSSSASLSSDSDSSSSDSDNSSSDSDSEKPPNP